MHTTTVSVTGMTCQHCVNAVSEELRELAGVRDVAVDLDAGAASRVHITSEGELAAADIAAAIDEAGYEVV